MTIMAFAMILLGLVLGMKKAMTVRARNAGQDPRAIACVLESEGQIVIIRGADAIPYDPAMQLLGGDCYRTLDDSRITVQYLDKSAKVTLMRNTNMYFLSSKGGKRINLAGGEAEFVIEDQPKGEPMIIATSNSEGEALEPGEYRIVFRDVVNRYDVISGKLLVRTFATGATREVNAGESYIPDTYGRIDGSIFEEDTNF